MSPNEIDDGLEDLKEIRSMMERATRFLSLSGLSGVSAGTVALLGTATALWYLGTREMAFTDPAVRGFLIADALVVLLLASGLSVLFSYRMAVRKRLRFGGPAARELLISLGVPLLSGGLFLFVLISRGQMALVPGASLLFYGLALFATAQHTVRDVRHLGVLEIVCGLTASALPEAGPVIWGIGFGLLHIAYGIRMFWKYER